MENGKEEVIEDLIIGGISQGIQEDSFRWIDAEVEELVVSLVTEERSPRSGRKPHDQLLRFSVFGSFDVGRWSKKD